MTQWNFRGTSYTGCSAAAGWDPWCYVQGGANCNQYQNSTENGETRKWRYCDACNCMTQWNYNGASYRGCSTTPDTSIQWCYVQGGASCNQHQDSEVDGETRKWRECDACDCMSQWNYKGASYTGCSTTADGDTPWCYVQGESNCRPYNDSLEVGDTRKWRVCAGEEISAAASTVASIVGIILLSTLLA